MYTPNSIVQYTEIYDIIYANKAVKYVMHIANYIAISMVLY